MGCSQTLTKEDENTFKDKDKLVKKNKRQEKYIKSKRRRNRGRGK